MKKMTRLLALLMALLMALSASALGETAEEPAPLEDPVLFTLDGTTFTKSQVDAQLADMLAAGYVDSQSDYQTVIDYMSNHRKELDNCTNIIRGIRNAEDAVAEIDLAGCYQYFSHDIRFEFIPLLASDKYRYVSSTLVKEMYRVNNEHPMPEFNEKVPLSVPVRQVCDEAYPAKVFGDTIAHLAMPWM